MRWDVSARSREAATSGSHDRERDEIEWEDGMVDVDRITAVANMRWNFVDRLTSAVDHAFDSQSRVGDKVKLRLVNTRDLRDREHEGQVEEELERG